MMSTLPFPPFVFSPLLPSFLSLFFAHSGADITDYFNYGFTEETWRLYCEKQRKTKAEVIQLNKIAVSVTLPGSITSPLPSLSLRWYCSLSVVDFSSLFGNTNSNYNCSLRNMVMSHHVILLMFALCYFCVNGSRFLNFARPF